MLTSGEANGYLDGVRVQTFKPLQIVGAQRFVDAALLQSSGNPHFCTASGHLCKACKDFFKRALRTHQR